MYAVHYFLRNMFTTTYICGSLLYPEGMQCHNDKGLTGQFTLESPHLGYIQKNLRLKYKEL